MMLANLLHRCLAAIVNLSHFQWEPRKSAQQIVVEPARPPHDSRGRSELRFRLGFAKGGKTEYHFPYDGKIGIAEPLGNVVTPNRVNGLSDSV